ncbi:hypothetical protein COEREDRAFT_88886 [Coemansia reversa NRRL 1564]|uniref:Uncharacterized protein n=1 Tax=Coemansia reversa (strain ATCC 12441 / NRRL 1564) TaxID=763665 RepID=A0A2G5B672_COERN|nr:hypothetical protein COEREDRAFT_88886 [Coemansia reversa NRRL 1564]|eukprot:PIA14217.1 hypothetical protein COEREDRAFT_88886 [Coemansia reversa NRRL 1564]
MEIILGLILAITLKSVSYHIANVLKRVLIWISSFVAYSVGLTEYVTGQINILDEGRWSIKYAPWLHIPLSSICMPNHIVQNVFKQESAKILDMARVGRVEQALPSNEYYAHMQQAIDSALESTYSSLAFTLQPNNMRVPGKHFMKIPNNRVTRVPVDVFGFPVDSIYDYEVADNPQKRNKAISEGYVVPYPVANSSKVDMRFKSMDYSVVYVPSMLELRELAYTALTLFGLGMVIVATLALALYIGGYILHPVYNNLRETASPLYLGLLVILAIGVAVIHGLKAFEKVFTFEKSLIKKLQIVFQNALEISRCTFNVVITITLFAAVIPTLACTVIEIYYAVLHRHSNDNFYSVNTVSTSMWGLLTRVWFTHIFTVIICAGASYMLSAVDWINHVVLLLWQSPQKWPMHRIICVYAAPATFKLALATGLPVALGLLSSTYNNDLTMDKARNILLLNDTTTLAPNVRLILLAIIGRFAALRGFALYKKCAGIVRVRLYSLGQVLENIDGSNTPLSARVSSE